MLVNCSTGNGSNDASFSEYNTDGNHPVPLSMLKETLESYGATVVYVPGSWNGTSDQPIFSAGLQSILEQFKGKMFFYVGHSYGANGFVDSQANNPNSNLLGMVLLDPVLVDIASVGESAYNQSSQSQTVASNLGIPILVASSTSSASGPNEQPFPGNGITFIPPVGGTHRGLANNPSINNDIVNWMISITRGGQ